jgi:hypothetical protein
MLAFQLTLLDGDVALGVLFDDGCVYVHDPIFKPYDSQSDMLEDVAGSTFQLIGPFMSFERAKNLLNEHYQQAMRAIDKEQKRIKKEHQSSLQRLEHDIKGCEAK